MKKLYFSFAFIFVLAVAVVFPVRTHAAEVVGRETYAVTWDRPADATAFQLYYGETNAKSNTVPGLTADSRSLTLNALKACTQYYWNVKYLRGNTWNWVYSPDHVFTTGGACSKTDAVGHFTTTATGRQTTIVGIGSATATWTATDGATGYNVYYREAGNKSWTHSVWTGPTTTAVTINHLDPNTTYYYRVAAVVNNTEVWQAEKMLLRATVSTSPVLGAYMPNNNTSTLRPRTEIYQVTNRVLAQESDSAMHSDSMMMSKNTSASCTGTTQATVIWTAPQTSVAKFHVLYGVNGYQHALRDLSSEAARVTIGYLNACTTYTFRVQAVNQDGSTTWITPTVVYN